MLTLHGGSKKPVLWKNPDFYIGLSYASYLIFFVLLVFGPHLIAFLGGGKRIAQGAAILFLIAGALFSGAGNWLGMDYDLYPEYTEPPSEELLEELGELIRERQAELDAEKVGAEAEDKIQV